MMLGTKEILSLYFIYFMLKCSYAEDIFTFILISFRFPFSFNFIEMDNLTCYLFFRFKIIKELQGR